MGMTRREEQKLIRRAAAGDKEAAGDLIRAHQGSLYAYMYRLSGKADVAEDTVQEAFVRVLTNLHRFDERYRFSTWLFTIARRLYVNACQKLKPAYDTDTVGNARGKGGTPGEPVVANEQLRHTQSALDDALDSLGAEQREILIRFHQQGWPIALIADHMDMPEGTVKSHLHRGRRKMRALLSEHEVHGSRMEEVLGLANEFADAEEART
ncbi:MAG: RNA polymerase sigma factor [Planctomycetota bacterium]